MAYQQTKQTRSRTTYYSSTLGAQRPSVRRRGGPGLKLAVVVVILLVALGGYAYAQYGRNDAPVSKSAPVSATASSNKNTTKNTATTPSPKKAPVATVVSYCKSNTLNQNVVVSISKRHLWACDGTKSLYDSAVVTGMENLPADLTPVGTYHIYSKQTDLYLNGSDSTGNWHDYVNYWMPWLSNQYGVYGFHDATWRKPTAFGNISPYSSDASHGCVELPLATAKWLYGWAQVGTTVTIQS